MDSTAGGTITAVMLRMLELSAKVYPCMIKSGNS